MQNLLKKMMLLILSVFLSLGLLAATKGVVPSKEQNKDKLEIFENFVCKGKIQNATRIKVMLKELSKEQIAKFDENHKGFIRAYNILSPNGHYKMKTDWRIEDSVKTAYLLDEFVETLMKVLEIKKNDLLECEIHLYRSPEEFRRIVASMGLGMGIGGWFREDQCMIMGFWNPDPMHHHETTLIHESTHLVNALLRRKWNNVARMPTWLDEGMAVFFESSYLPWTQKIEIGRNSFSRLIWLKNTINNPDLPDDKKWTPLKTLLNYPAMIPPQCYGESWAIVHYLCYEYGESKKKPFTEFRRYWENVYRGKKNGYYADLEIFVKERSKQSLEDFLKDVLAYAKELKLPVTYMADGKTLLEWELGFPDTVAKSETSKTPWLIKMKDPKVMKSAAEADIAMLTISQIDEDSSAANCLGEELTGEFKDFFVPGMADKFSKIELENKSGTVSFEGDYLQLEVPAKGISSEVYLKITETEEIEITLKMKIDKGSSGIRFSGKKDNNKSGYYLGYGDGCFFLGDLDNLEPALAEAKDENAKKEARSKFIQVVNAPIKLEQEYELTIKLQGKTATVLNEKGESLAKFDVKNMKASPISIHVPPSSKMCFTNLKVKKP